MLTSRIDRPQPSSNSVTLRKTVVFAQDGYHILSTDIVTVTVGVSDRELVSVTTVFTLRLSL